MSAPCPAAPRGAVELYCCSSMIIRLLIWNVSAMLQASTKGGMSDARFLKLWSEAVRSLEAFAIDQSSRTTGRCQAFDVGLLSQQLLKLPPASNRAWKKLVDELQVQHQRVLLGHWPGCCKWGCCKRGCCTCSMPCCDHVAYHAGQPGTGCRWNW